MDDLSLDRWLASQACPAIFKNSKVDCCVRMIVLVLVNDSVPFVVDFELLLVIKIDLLTSSIFSLSNSLFQFSTLSCVIILSILIIKVASFFASLF